MPRSLQLGRDSTTRSQHPSGQPGTHTIYPRSCLLHCSCCGLGVRARPADPYLSAHEAVHASSRSPLCVRGQCSRVHAIGTARQGPVRSCSCPNEQHPRDAGRNPSPIIVVPCDRHDTPVVVEPCCSWLARQEPWDSQAGSPSYCSIDRGLTDQ